MAVTLPTGETLHISNAVLTLSRTLQHYKRGKLVHADNINLATVVDTIRKDHQVTAAGIVKNTPGIIRYEDNPSTVNNAPNGWSEARLFFNITVDVESGPIVKKYHLQGYTSHFDVSHMGTLDPNITFYINSVVGELHTPDPMNPGYPLIRPLGAFELLHNPITQRDELVKDFSVRTTPAEQLYTARPEDIVTEVMAADLRKGTDAGNVINNTAKLNVGSGRPSSAANLIPASGVAKVINSYINAVGPQSGTVTDDYALSITAGDQVAEINPITIPFFKLLMEEQTENGMYLRADAPTSFTYGWLRSRFPEIENYRPALTSTGGAFDPTVNHADTGSVNKESTIATVISEAVKGLALLNKLSILTFDVSNLDNIMYPTYNVFNAKSYIQSVDPVIEADKTVKMLLAQVWPVITEGNTIPLQIFVDYDETTGTRVSVSFAGNHAENRYVPTQMSGLASSDILSEPAFNYTVDNYTDLTNEIRIGV